MVGVLAAPSRPPEVKSQAEPSVDKSLSRVFEETKVVSHG